MPRLFIALEISDEIKRSLSSFQEDLKNDLRCVTWVKKNAQHLTLKFLGEVAEDRTTSIKEALTQAVGQLPCFELEIKGVGVFPDWNKTKVLWAGIGDAENIVKLLAGKVTDSMEKLGFAREDKEFVPHLTIGRVRGNLGINNKDKTKIAQEIFAERKDFSFGNQTVPDIVLMKSVLIPEGATTYTSSGRIPLSGKV